MSKAFNHRQFTLDYTRLMHAQQPSLQLQHTLLEKMEAESARRHEWQADTSALDFVARKESSIKRKTWLRIGQLAAVLALASALYLIYPLLSSSSSKTMPMQSAEIAMTSAAFEMQDMAQAKEGSPEPLLTAAGAAPTEAAQTKAAQTAEDYASLETAMIPEQTRIDEANFDGTVLLDLSAELSVNVFRSSAIKAFESFTLNIFNRSDKVYYVGLALNIQKLANSGEWEDLSLKEGIMWPAIAYEIPVQKNGIPGVYSEEIKLKDLMDELEPGTYRLVKEINGEQLWVEFSIVD